MLAQRTSLDQNLTGSEVKNAFQKSGLFLEASLASGSPPAGVPDLKAALIVLRQTLLSSLGGSGSGGCGGAAAGPSCRADTDCQQTLSPQARLAVAEDLPARTAGRARRPPPR